MASDPSLDQELTGALHDALSESRTARKQKKPPQDCPTCGQPFYPSKNWQRFCSIKCRSQYHNEREDIMREQKAVELERLKLDYQEALREISILQHENARLQARIKELE